FRCNFLMAGFVKKTLSKAHGTVVEAMGRKAQLVGAPAGPPAPIGSVTHGGGGVAPFAVPQQQQHHGGVVQYGSGRDEGGGSIPGAAFQQAPPPWAAPDVQNRAHAPMIFSELDATGDHKIQAR
ncbi:unnamed protein product, partial [Clonostachys rosea]